MNNPVFEGPRRGRINPSGMLKRRRSLATLNGQQLSISRTHPDLQPTGSIMSPVPNPTIIFISNPQGIPVPGENLIYRQDITIDIDSEPLHGGILTKTVGLGIDVYLRNRMGYEYKPNTP